MAEQKDWSKWAPAGELLEKQAKQRVGPETAYTVALEALEKITAVSSGSYNAAVDLKDALAVKLSAEDHERVEPVLQDLITNTQKVVEELQGLNDLIRQIADGNAERETKSRRIELIGVGIGIIGVLVGVALRLIG
jgi:hypothetical protein